METCVMDSILLEPYSRERLLVVSGFNYQDVLAWFDDNYGVAPTKNLLGIKKFYQEKKEWLDFLLDNKDELDGFDQGGDAKGNAIYSYAKAKSCGFMMRMIILRYGFKPTSPDNMRTLAHECLHVCQEFLPQFLNRDEEMEAEAYFHSYLMESIYGLFL